MKLAVTCEECGHRGVWDVLMDKAEPVRIPCIGCKEMLIVMPEQDALDIANHKMPSSLKMWEGLIRV